MKFMIAKLAALHLTGLCLTAAFVLQALGPMFERDQAAQARVRAAGLAQSLARAAAGAHGPRQAATLQQALAGAQSAPGVAWACLLMRDGHTLCLPGSPLSKPLTRLLHGTQAAPLALGPPQAAQSVTVFRSAGGGPLLAADVALSDTFLHGQVVQAEWAAVGGLAAVWASVTVALLLSVRRSFGGLESFLRALRGAGGSATGLKPLPGAAGEMGALAKAVNGLLAQVHAREQEARQAEARCRSTVEDAVIGFWQSTPEGRILSANKAMARIYGYESPQDLLRVAAEGGLEVYIDSEYRGRFLRLLMERGTLNACEAQIRRASGEVVWISETARSVRDAHGALVCFEGTVEDISARRQAEADRANLGSHLRLLLESSGEGIYGVDLQGKCTFINKAAAQMLGYGTNELLGRRIHDAIQGRHADRSDYPEDRSYVYHAMRNERTVRVDDEVLWRKDGGQFAVEYTASPLMKDGRIAGAVVTFVDITARKAVDAERERLLAEAIDRADHDPLTGLLNHRAFQRRLEEEADRAQRAGGLLAIALLDIDNFKFFNDVYGHKVGDEVLQQVAAALRGSSRSYDALSRFGGDEFAVLMPCKGGETASELTAHLRQRLSGVSYRPDGYDQAIPLGLSVGLALFPSEGAARTDVIDLADERLRRSKTGGDDDGYAESVRESLNCSREGFSMLDALVTSVDNKDRYTRRHSEDVMRYCVEISDALGLDAQTRRLLETAALIHDVGKIGVPDNILRKPGRLTEAEFAAIQQHPTMGAVIAESVSGFEETLDAVRYHHERWDGGGYPFGLRGEETPLIARVMSVADAFSAMTTDRPYRKGMPHAKALGILSEGGGIQWDPQCVAAFLQARQGAVAPVLAV